ncbi:DUF4132 domain-containing protein [Corynebacterium hansenii]|uniref:DUF4132 domain-containing protein n=1 Tax=Corynebacterium hansenii TaxID=394964 RepID=A0ABV7ZR02_9CORY|nr:DUF4132 domain-containing protein [Corynebacterium hansenii]WJZ00090.1 hypothetical protein CHAN_07380 [Corynebacterium hansenii]
MTASAAEWIDAGDYQFLLDGEEILARNAKGQLLKTVPAKARKLPEYDRLDALRTSLAQHRVECSDTVREWFLSGSPIPSRLIAAVWPDPSWRAMFADAVVEYDGSEGLLRAADDDGLSLVDLDGETVTVPVDDDTMVILPHPVLMEDLADWREFSVELGILQGFDQLFRDTHRKPADAAGRRAAMEKYRDAKYARANALVGRSRGGGFSVEFSEGVTGIYLRVVEDIGGRRVETTATLQVDDDYEGGATLRDLYFSRNGIAIKPEDVGPVTWSEGVRMAEFVYGGRTIGDDAAQA